jgi:hypothetical protein
MTETKNLKFWITVLIFGFFLPAGQTVIFIPVCYAQPISSNELINNTRQYDGETVVFEGEVIGDVMVRGEYAWININDGKSAIGIWLKKDLAEDILYTGNYKSKGDWVEVTGRGFRYSCTTDKKDKHWQAGSRKV